MSVCAFCGEPATHERVELSPPKMESATITDRNGCPMPGQRLARAAVVRDLCDTHYAVYERNKGWQERERKQREERRQQLYGDLKRNQLDLFADQEAA